MSRLLDVDVVHGTYLAGFHTCLGRMRQRPAICHQCRPPTMLVVARKGPLRVRIWGHRKASCVDTIVAWHCTCAVKSHVRVAAQCLLCSTVEQQIRLLTWPCL